MNLTMQLGYSAFTKLLLLKLYWSSNIYSRIFEKEWKVGKVQSIKSSSNALKMMVLFTHLVNYFFHFQLFQG